MNILPSIFAHFILPNITILTKSGIKSVSHVQLHAQWRVTWNKKSKLLEQQVDNCSFIRQDFLSMLHSAIQNLNILLLAHNPCMKTLTLVN